MKLLSKYTVMMLTLASLSVSGCYKYHERSKVMIPNIDIAQTLEVAEQELKINKRTRANTLWAIRDQALTPEQAKRVSDLYFQYVDTIDSETQESRGFAMWHLTWTISNIYREGDADIKDVMAEAYRDAAKRVETLNMKIATQYFYGEKIQMGDWHMFGRRYAKKHLVVPGNADYLQSASEYQPGDDEN